MHFYQMRVDFSSDLSAGFPAFMDKWDSFCGGVTPSREGATRGREATHIMLRAQRCKQPPAAAAAAKWQHKSEARL